MKSELVNSQIHIVDKNLFVLFLVDLSSRTILPRLEGYYHPLYPAIMNQIKKRFSVTVPLITVALILVLI